MPTAALQYGHASSAPNRDKPEGRGRTLSHGGLQPGGEMLGLGTQIACFA